MSPKTPDEVGATPPAAQFDDSLARGRLGPYGTWPYVERRVQVDRRVSGTRLFSSYMLRGHRLRGRRQGETRNVYVDRYRPGDLALAGAILVLNIFDAWFTLDYRGTGGTEANPIARFLMEQGTGWFIFSKAVVVAFCVLFLMMHKTFHCVRPAMWALFGFYSSLLVYHLFLQFAVSPAPGL